MSDYSLVDPLNSSYLNGIVILGMHRSGTSAFTGLLNALGFSAGKNLMPANEFNISGYFEDIHMIEQHDALLNRLDSSWSDVRLFPVRWFDQDWVAGACDKLAELFLEEFDSSQLWVLKDPRICRLLPIWKQIFTKLHIESSYVIMLRHPTEVAASLEKRDGIRTNNALLLYSLYLLEAERETRNLPRVVVEYTDLLDNWLQVVENIEGNLSLSLPAIEDDTLQQIDSFLSRDLRHHTVQNSDGEVITQKANKVVGSKKTIVPDLENQIDLLSDKREQAIFKNEPFDIALEVYRLLAGPNPFNNQEGFDDLWCRLEIHLHKLAQEAQLQRDCLAKYMTMDFLKPDDKIERILSRDAMSSIYWCSVGDSEYSEPKTIKLPLHYGPMETLRFVMPVKCKEITKMRWDIAERGVLCEVFQAWVENLQKEKVWQWKQHMSLIGAPSADMKIIRSTGDHKRLLLLSTGGDPHGQLSIPSDVIAQMEEGWAFVAVISVALPTMAIPMLCDLLKEYETEIDTRKESSEKHSGAVNNVEYHIPRLAEGLEEVLTSLHKTLAQQDRTIVKQQQQLGQLGEELIRAEAQLELLKDVMWGKSNPDTC